MRVLILGLNYRPEQIGIAVYTAGLAEELTALGHEVSVVAGQPYYPMWRIAPAYRGWWRTTVENGVAVTRCPLYVPATPSGLKRLLHHASFALSALVPTVWKAATTRPDVVFTAAPSLIAAPVAWLAARLCGARAWLHLQDLEVEAAVATGLLRRESRLVRLAQAVERRVVAAFDRVSSIGPEMCRRVAAMLGAPVYELRNWADVDGILPLAGPSPYRTEWGIAAPHVALYSGNIANKQGIEIVVEAARRLAHRDDIAFVICGEGPTRARLEAEAATLPNLQLRDLQPAARLGDLLGLASVHLLPQKADAADLVLPSKLTNMLASGRPTVATAAPGTGLAREVEGCGICVPPEDGAAFAGAIAALIDDAPRRAALGVAARARAEERWRRSQIVARAAAEMARR